MTARHDWLCDLATDRLEDAAARERPQRDVSTPTITMTLSDAQRILELLETGREAVRVVASNHSSGDIYRRIIERQEREVLELLETEPDGPWKERLRKILE